MTKTASGLAGLGTWLAMASVSAAAGLPVLVLNDTNQAPLTTADGAGFLDVVAGEAFRRVGVRLHLVRLPAERGLINANAGIDDGDLTRIAGLEAAYPNLVRVPEKLMDWEFTAFGKQASLPATWDGLRGRAVGHIRGWKIYEQQFADAPLVLNAEDATQLFQQLELGRIDVALYERWQGLTLLRGLRMAGVHALAPPLATRPMYIYLHKRHAALVPGLAQALRAIKAEGLYDRLYREKVLVPVAAPVE